MKPAGLEAMTPCYQALGRMVLVCSLLFWGSKPEPEEGASGLPVTMQVEHAANSTVGYPVIFRGVMIPAPEVEPVPATDKDRPVVVQINSVQRLGDRFRYELEVTGLDPGVFDVGQYLRGIDGGPTPDIPRIELTVESLLPAGAVLPHDPVEMRTGMMGWYIPALVAMGILWLTGLMAILFARRQRTRHPGKGQTKLSLADRIRPVVMQAAAGQLSVREGAELERTLTAFWRHQLRLEHLPPDQLMRSLRRHDEAGPLLQQLELWLHKPEPGEVPDLEKILLPYRRYSENEYGRGLNG